MPNDPRIREILALFIGYSRIYRDVLKGYDHNVVLLREMLVEDDFNGIKQDVTEEIIRETDKKM